MKSNFLVFAVLVLSAAISCTPAPKEAQQQSNPQQMNQLQIQQLKQDASALSSTETPAVTAPVQTTSAVKLNPPHGQPGHLCEIPVGSPLPDAQASANSKTSGSAQAAPAVANPVKLNPPHGQPGHICEIPVGSPLP